MIIVAIKLMKYEFNCSTFSCFSTPNSAGSYGPMQGNSISSPTKAMHDGSSKTTEIIAFSNAISINDSWPKSK